MKTVSVLVSLLVVGTLLVGCTTSSADPSSEGTAVVVSVNGAVALVQLENQEQCTALNPFPELKVGDLVHIFQPDYGPYMNIGERQIVAIEDTEG